MLLRASWSSSLWAIVGLGLQARPPRGAARRACHPVRADVPATRLGLHQRGPARRWWMSIQMAWIGTLIGAVLSLPLGFFAAHNVSPRPVSVTIRVLLDAIRAFPELVLRGRHLRAHRGARAVRGRAGHRHPLRGHPGQADRGGHRVHRPGSRGGRARERGVSASRSSAGASCRRCCRRSSRSGCTASRSTSGRRPCWASWVPVASASLLATRHSASGATTRRAWSSSWWSSRPHHRRHLGSRPPTRHRGPGWPAARGSPRGRSELRVAEPAHASPAPRVLDSPDTRGDPTPEPTSLHPAHPRVPRDRGARPARSGRLPLG